MKVAFSWRLVWYSVLIWFLALIFASFVVLPWFYLVLPPVVFWTTAYFFKKVERSFEAGLKVSLFWFLIISALAVFEIAGPYYFNFVYYFSDQRNLLIYPLILLIPSIYSLMLENKSKKVFRSKRTTVSALRRGLKHQVSL